MRGIYCTLIFKNLCTKQKDNLETGGAVFVFSDLHSGVNTLGNLVCSEEKSLLG